jgi:tetratricopeptide (TPR) repeat protein
MSKKTRSTRPAPASAASDREQRTADATPVPAPLSWTNALPFFALAFLRIVAAFAPPSYLWGLGVISYLPLSVALALIGLGIVVAVPAAASALAAWIDAAAGWFFPADTRKSWTAVVVAATCFGLLTWFLTMPYPFLGGDGVHVIRRLFRFNTGVLREYGQMGTEYLTVRLYALLGSLTQDGGDANGLINIAGYTGVFRLAGSMGGAVFFCAAYLAARRLLDTPLARMAMLASLLCLPGSLFFFGYVEMYLFAYLFGAAFLLFGIVELQRPRFPLWSTLALIGGMAFHVSTAAFLPAYVLLLHSWYLKTRNGVITTRGIVLVYFLLIPVLGIAAYALPASGGAVSVFIPLTAPGHALSLFSVRHVADLANHLLLLAPAGIAVLLLATSRAGDRHPISGAVWFAMVAAMGWFGLCVTQYGFAHDWDIFASLGTALACAAVFAATGVRSETFRRYLLVQCALQPLLLVAPWIAVHTQRDVAVQRYAELSDSYAGILRNATLAGFYETLRSAAAATTDAAQEIGYIRRGIDVTDDPYEYVKLLRAIAGSEQLTSGAVADVTRALDTLAVRSERLYAIPLGEDSLARSSNIGQVAIDILRQTSRRLAKEQRLQWASPIAERFIARGRNIYGMHAVLGNAAFESGDLSQAMIRYRAALTDTASFGYRSDLTRPMVLNRLAIALFQLGERAEALATFRLAVSLPDALAMTWSDYGFACYQSMAFAEAGTAFRKALALDPGIPIAMYCLGKILFIDPARQTEGIALLRRFTAAEQGTERARDAEQLLRSVAK